MSIRTLSVITLSAASLLLAGGAWAQASTTPRVDKRQENQQARIDQGVASGQLTVREQRRLEAEQRAIARGESAAKADGTVTPGERRALNRAQNRAGHDIARQKHDRQRRGN